MRIEIVYSLLDHWSDEHYIGLYGDVNQKNETPSFDQTQVDIEHHFGFYGYSLVRH